MNRLYQWKWEVVAPISGILLTLAFAPFDFAYLALAALMIFYVFSTQTSLKRVALDGYLFGLGLFGSGIWWVYISIHDFGGADAVSACLLTASLIAVWSLLPVLTALALFKLSKMTAIWSRVTCSALAWVTVEYFRGSWLFNGFPWLQIAYSQLDTPLAGFAPVIGVYGMGFLLALSAFTVVETLLRRIVWWHGLIVCSVIWGGGWALHTIHWTDVAGEAFKITLIQGNIDQDQKWLPSQKPNTLKLYRQLTEQHWDSSVVVWPETAIPAFLSEVRDSYLNPLAIAAREHGTDLIVSLPTGGNKTYYNSVMTLGHDEAFYHKSHLLPFGEYLPLQPFSGWILDQLSIPLGSFTAGSQSQPLLKAGGYPFVATICYEDAFGQLVINRVADAAYLVNVTNDAWFGDSSEPYQHMQMAQFRALEAGRYLVRATNTGVSGIIGPDGKPRQQSKLFATTTLTDDIIPMSGLTPYARIGDIGVFSSMFAFVAALFGWKALFTDTRYKRPIRA